MLAPCVARGLIHLVERAQIEQHFLLHTAVKFISRRIPWLFCRSRQEALHWDDPEDVVVPIDLLCPITNALFVSPVVLHGTVFEESAVRRWVEATSRHPTLQGIWCATSELEPAQDVANLCSRFGAAHGLQLRPDSERESLAISS